MMALDYVVGAAFEKVLLFRVADLFAGFEGSGSGFLFGFGPVDGVNIHLSLAYGKYFLRDLRIA